jgi:hypothetical protein
LLTFIGRAGSPKGSKISRELCYYFG